MALIAIKVIVLYRLSAVFVIVINIGFQLLSIWAYKGTYSVEVSILVGTAASLTLLYFLEKSFMLIFATNNLAHDGRLLVFYSTMGVITMLIFWGTKYTSHLIYGAVYLRYVVGVIGLAAGFYSKYQLFKKNLYVSQNYEVQQFQ